MRGCESLTAWLTIALLAACASGVRAQGDPSGGADLTDLSIEELLNVEVQSVLGASRFLQKTTEAPASVTVVTSEEIARFGHRTLADVLRTVRGLYVTNDRAYSYVGVRGFQRPADYNTRVLLLVDGHRLNDNIYDQGGIGEDLPFDLDIVERIEIIRGPSSSVYGSSAFLGVINVVTKAASQQAGVRVRADVGSLGLSRTGITMGHVFRTGTQVTLAGNWTRQTGAARLFFDAFDSPETNGGVAEGLDATTQSNVFASLARGGFTIRGAFNSREKRLPTAPWGTAFNDPRTRIDDDRAFLDAGWTGPIRPTLTVSVRTAYDSYAYLGVLPFDLEGAAGETVLHRDLAQGQWLTTEALMTWTGLRRHRLTVGIERRDHLQQLQRYYVVEPRDILGEVDPREHVTGLFMQDEIRLNDKVLLNVGLRRDATASSDRPTKPRAALVLTPGGASTLKFMYGEAFRAPNVYERLYASTEDKPNPFLEPETIRTFETSFERQWGPRYRTTVDAFAYQVSHLIDYAVDSSDGLNQFQNVDAVRSYGVEAELEAHWSNGIRARASTSWQRTRDLVLAEPLTNSPSTITQGLLLVPFLGKAAFAGIDFRSIGARTTWSGQTAARHTVVNVTLTTAAWRHLDLRFSVANALNSLYADPGTEDFRQALLPQDGRRVSAGISYAF